MALSGRRLVPLATAAALLAGCTAGTAQGVGGVAPSGGLRRGATTTPAPGATAPDRPTGNGPILTGRLLRGDGSAAKGVTVSAVRGLQDVGHAAVGDDGAFRIVVAGVGAVTLDATAGRDGDSGILSLDLPVVAGQVDVGELRFWEPTTRATPQPDDLLVLHWDAPPSGQSWLLTARIATWSVTRSAEGMATGTTLDRRLLEDAPLPSFDLEAEAHPVIGGKIADLHLLAPGDPLPAALLAGPPPSRGKPCTVRTSPSLSANVSPCPLTDGDLDGSSTAGAGSPLARAIEAVVDLGEAAYGELSVRPVDDDGVRRSTGYEVSVSADGRTWTVTTSPDQGIVATTAPIRFVRLRGDLRSVAEVSAWR